ncbi:MAG: immunity 8 family protein [Chloroflexota bacterium]|nr:immunity 8 family protein [Chloroflexota bacterium]
MTEMLQAELLYLHSADALDLEAFIPEDPDSFGLFLEAAIGIKGEVGQEILGFMVCTPNWLRDVYMPREDELCTFGHQFIFLKRYDYHLLWNIIKELCETTRSDKLEVIFERLARYGRWSDIEDLHS